jgi:hypothetical protein
MVFLTQNLHFTLMKLHLSGCINTQNNRHWTSINIRHDFWSTPSQSEKWYMLCHYFYMNSRNHSLLEHYCLRAERRHSSIYCYGEFFKQFIYFHKWTYMFTMCSILNHNMRLFSSADDGGVLGTQANSKTVRWFRCLWKTLYIEELGYKLSDGNPITDHTIYCACNAAKGQCNWVSSAEWPDWLY